MCNPFFPEGNSGIVLITNDRPQNSGLYPTMFMIMGQLVRKLINPSLCFLNDSPRISPNFHPIACRTPRCLSTERSYDQNPKNSSFVFNRIPEEEFGKLGTEPTISMIIRGLTPYGEGSVAAYLIETKAVSVLALGRESLLTHDVDEGITLSPEMLLLSSTTPPVNC